MNNLNASLARCEREIASALKEGQHPHTQAEQLGILIWELDWRAERETILEERGTADKARRCDG